jgi:hypothetical protein
MDTMTYASIAVIPWSIAESGQRPVVPEPEFAPFNLSFIVRGPTHSSSCEGLPSD